MCMSIVLKEKRNTGLELAKNYRLTKIQLKVVESIIQGHYDEFKAAWNSHFRD
jgi:hypothetical protein